MSVQTKNIKKNYKSIIGVTLLAFLLWFMVKMSRTYEYSYELPIRFINLDSTRTFKFAHQKTVKVVFVGKGIDLLRLSFMNIYYQVDLSGVPDHFRLDLTQNKESVRYPGDLNISIKSIVSPRILTVETDEKVRRKLPVEVEYQLDTPAGYILAGVTASPDSVVITGPSEMFRKLKKIKTESKIFSDAGVAFTKEFAIQKPERYFAECQPKTVQVFFDIQRLAEKEVLDVPVTVVDHPKHIQVIPLPSRAIIYVKGGEKILADLQASDFKIEIDFNKSWKPGIKKVKANLITKADVLYMESRPPEFELIVQKMRAK
ncbi:hypothetical protein B1H10_06080 [candidate division KSB1 bacterium 4484_188]|nr:MAG: hypothetical protein B1H10_06080 [candidate division KSB1 bacterium 4484_188]